MARKKYYDPDEDRVSIEGGDICIPRIDAELFDRVKTEYVSEAEQKFFEQMKHRESHYDCYAVMGDLLVHEDDNPDGVHLQRDYDCEFWVLIKDPTTGEWKGTNEHYFSLVQVLQDSVGDTGLTLWEWLRKTDYKYVHYDRNYGQ